MVKTLKNGAARSFLRLERLSWFSHDLNFWIFRQFRQFRQAEIDTGSNSERKIKEKTKKNH